MAVMKIIITALLTVSQAQGKHKRKCITLVSGAYG